LNIVYRNSCQKQESDEERRKKRYNNYDVATTTIKNFKLSLVVK
jgi:hypothetical protein